jgi:hypothetical protein
MIERLFFLSVAENPVYGKISANIVEIVLNPRNQRLP